MDRFDSELDFSPAHGAATDCPSFKERCELLDRLFIESFPSPDDLLPTMDQAYLRIQARRFAGLILRDADRYGPGAEDRRIAMSLIKEALGHALAARRAAEESDRLAAQCYCPRCGRKR